MAASDEVVIQLLTVVSRTEETRPVLGAGCQLWLLVLCLCLVRIRNKLLFRWWLSRGRHRAGGWSLLGRADMWVLRREVWKLLPVSRAEVRLPWFPPAHFPSSNVFGFFHLRPLLILENFAQFQV